MSTIHDVSAPKKPANLTVNSDLLNQAKALKMNISAVLESALIESIKKAKQEEWTRENESAMKEYNERIKEYGLFSDEMRTF
ncbi:MAG TPA: type II toxin-antitoxin system CcdA family antitoxin [Treponemataceae bacterium]|jgi:antitoxin CcdA|nr:type II toxin-antitoxin system CcdA family antitoxin [Treponemataceae bacterium]